MPNMSRDCVLLPLGGAPVSPEDRNMAIARSFAHVKVVAMSCVPSTSGSWNRTSWTSVMSSPDHAIQPIRIAVGMVLSTISRNPSAGQFDTLSRSSAPSRFPDATALTMTTASSTCLPLGSLVACASLSCVTTAQRWESDTPKPMPRWELPPPTASDSSVRDVQKNTIALAMSWNPGQWISSVVPTAPVGAVKKPRAHMRVGGCVVVADVDRDVEREVLRLVEREVERLVDALVL